jgi:uncharacterized protein (TIGR04255 family)
VRRHYQNPPIAEALVEVFFKGSQWTLSIPGRFYEKVRESFPEERRRDQLGIQVNLGPEQAAARVESADPRSVFVAPDASQMIQLAPNLLVFNQLHSVRQQPYRHFEEWQPTVVQLVNLYQELAHPEGIERVGLRYINKVVIPRLSFNLSDYFAFYPYVPPEMAEGHGEFLMRVRITPLHTGHDLIVTFGSAPPELEKTTAFLLDYYNVAAADESSSRTAIERILTEAHDNVIHAFEHSITPAAQELFGLIDTGE